MLEDFRLRVFMTVACEGSFTKAASALNISQPAVSQHISELEKNTGVRLFERLRGEVRLTPQGRVFHSHAAAILDAYRSASSVFSPMEASQVRVKASDEVYSYLEEFLILFSQMHPEVEFLRSTDEDSELSFVFKPAPKAMGGITATHHIISNMFLCCKPSDAFSETDLFKNIRSFLADSI